MEASEAKKIVDEVNEVSNTKPIDTSGLFEGLERSASSMDAANNSLEQTIALITSANSVVQDADSVGTAFRTMSMRIRGAKTELEEAGEDTDGMATSTAKLREEIQALSGVDIMKDENTFKSTYDILDELASKWQDLTDIQQASVTELVAGKRQGNIMSALMSNFDIARDTLDTAMNNSTGSAEKELENWNKGIEASIAHFQAQFQELSTKTLDSQFLKGGIDAGTEFIHILTEIIDKFGILTPMITAIGAGAGIKNVGRDNRYLVTYAYPC
jgi:TP901 family phage tail tape measure protein